MKKLKLTAVLALMGASTAWGQTDVTKTYLTNADFESSEATTSDVKLVVNGGVCNSVTKWACEANSTETYYGAGVFSYGSTYKLNAVAPPSAPPVQGETNCLGILAAWSNTLKYTQAATLPAGRYTLKIYICNQNSGDKTKGSFAENYFGFVENGGTAHYGTTKYFTQKSWQTETVTFDLVEETAGKVSLGYKAADNTSGNNQTLFIDRVELYQDANGLTVLKEHLPTAISEAKSFVASAKNVGTEPFQKPQSLFDAIRDAITNAETALANESATEEVLLAAWKGLAAARTAYDEAPLNTPAEGDVFNFYITTNDGYRFKERYATFADDGVSGVSFYIASSRANAPYFAQTMMFKQVSGNLYTISSIDANGVERYMCTKGKVETKGGTSGIRLTTKAEDALSVEIIPSATVNGVYNLKNTEAKALLGCQDDKDPKGGLYTTDSHSNFKIIKTTMPSVALKTVAEYATIILPFKATIPEGLSVYSCSESEGQTLTLVPVETEMAANTPYIVKGATTFEHTFKGFGAATKASYKAGLLTGTYTEVTAKADTYVLQNLGNVAFYKVATGSEPKIDPNRAYLTMPASGEINALYFPTLGEETAAAEVKVADAVVDVLTINGVVVRKGVKASEALRGLKRGLYIVGGEKRVVNE